MGTKLPDELLSMSTLFPDAVLVVFERWILLQFKRKNYITKGKWNVL